MVEAPHEPAVPEWFAAQVWTRREHLIARQLTERGYEVFLPTFRERRKWSDRIKVIENALFPGYVFCRLTPNVIARMLTTPGVIRIIGDGRRPLPVASDEIESIRRIVAANTDSRPWPRVRVGDRVRVEHGPLSGIEGIVLRIKNAYRLFVAVSLLHRSVAVELDPAWLGAASPLFTSAGSTDRDCVPARHHRRSGSTRLGTLSGR